MSLRRTERYPIPGDQEWNDPWCPGDGEQGERVPPPGPPFPPPASRWLTDQFVKERMPALELDP